MDWSLDEMLSGFISTIFQFFMTILVTAIQVITWPINVILTEMAPDFSTQLTKVSTDLGQLLTFIPYALSYLPPGILTLLIFILGTEIILMYVFQSTYIVAKMWKIVQAIKFW